MKKAILIGIYIIYPLLLSAVLTFLSNNMYYGGDGYYYYTNNKIIYYGFLAVYYGSPFCGFYYFAKKRPFNQWLLFIGFALVPVYLTIYDYLYPPAKFQYLGVIISMFIYTLPFIIISLIFALIITIRDNRKK